MHQYVCKDSKVTGCIQSPHIRLKDLKTRPKIASPNTLPGHSWSAPGARSFDSVVGADEFAAKMLTYYNYIRPHQGIGWMVAAQMATMPINLRGADDRAGGKINQNQNRFFLLRATIFSLLNQVSRLSA